MKEHTRINGVFIEDHKTLKVTTQFLLTDLPLGVIHDILFRLPLFSIFNLKFVSRDFNKITSHPYFITNYSKLAPFVTFLLPRYRDGSPLTYQFLESPQFSDKNHKCFRTTFKPKIPGLGLADGSSRFDHICTCNGLLILLAHKSETKPETETETIYICNPIVGEYKALPELQTEFYTQYRIGYCGSSNSYKILRVSSPSSYPWGRKVEILTIGIDDAWRPLADLMHSIPMLRNLITVNGVFHWIGRDDYYNACIDTFDLGEEKIGQIPHPHGLELEYDHMQIASINNTHLSVADHSISGRVVLWEMREYGVEESWTKLMVLDNLSVLEIKRFRHFSEFIFQNGKLFYSGYVRWYPVTFKSITGEDNETVEWYDKRDTFTPTFLSLEEALMGGH